MRVDGVAIGDAQVSGEMEVQAEVSVRSRGSASGVRALFDRRSLFAFTLANEHSRCVGWPRTYNPTEHNFLVW